MPYRVDVKYHEAHIKLLGQYIQALEGLSGADDWIRPRIDRVKVRMVEEQELIQEDEERIRRLLGEEDTTGEPWHAPVTVPR
jgi:hypothetical protein